VAFNELAFEIIRVDRLDVALWLHTAMDPPDHAWRDAFQQVEAVLKLRGDPSYLRTFVVSDGGVPNTKQRSHIQKNLPGILTAVVTVAISNPVTRGIATALSWVSRNTVFFGPPDAQRAFEHLGLTDSLEEVWAGFLRLQMDMPPNKTLRLVAQALHLPAPETPLLARQG